jgi:hypothetical protein
MQGHSGGWLTSVPGDVEFQMQALPDSPLPELLRSAGYVATEVARSERILPHAIRQQFAAGKDGEMEPLTIGSTRPVAMTVTHAGIAAVIEYDLIPGGRRAGSADAHRAVNVVSSYRRPPVWARAAWAAILSVGLGSSGGVSAHLMDRPVFSGFVEHYPGGRELYDSAKAIAICRRIAYANPKMRVDDCTETCVDRAGVDFRLHYAGRNFRFLCFGRENCETSAHRLSGEEFVAKGLSPIINSNGAKLCYADFQMREYAQSGRFAKILQFETEIGSSPDLFVAVGYENKAVPFEGGNSDPRPLIGKRVFPIDFVGFNGGQSTVPCGFSGHRCVSHAPLHNLQLNPKERSLRRSNHEQEGGGISQNPRRYSEPPFVRRFLVALLFIPLGFGCAFLGGNHLYRKRCGLGAALIGVGGLLFCIGGGVIMLR